MTRDGLVVENWSRWGLHRLYVNAADDELVGWLDLDTGARSLENPDLASAFDAALEEAATRDDAVHCAPRRTVAEPVADFLFRQPGEHLKDYAARLVEVGDDPEAKSTMGAVSSPDQARWPRTAEELMRSRFEAFRTGDAEWLLASWHPSTRPRQIDLTGNPTWRALQIVETVQGGVADDTGIVEFRATYLRPGGGVDAQHERSRFVREEGRWYYLDAV